MDEATRPIWSVLRSRDQIGAPELPLLTVVSDVGVRVRDLAEGRAPSEDLSGYRVVREGDLVVNKMWARFGAYGVSSVDGIISPAYWVMRIDREWYEPRFVHHLLRSSAYRAEIWRRSKDMPPNGFDLPWDLFRTIRVPVVDRGWQRATADYLDAEIAAMDDLLSKKRRLVELLQEQIDSAIMDLVGQSAVVQGDHTLGALPVRRQLAKLDRPPEPDAQVITAFRDGQVTARAFRRSEGFTESWTEGARVQGVLRGDVVVHGLDGFAGAIGTSEADGVCSPVYHVCSPIDGGDAHFHGRMLRLLATTGYLGNFATSTRERAVDFRNWDLFGRIPIPIVEGAEQRRIGDRIRRLAPIRERVARSRVLINERKHALITAAVTGQLKIPGVAA